MADPDGGQHVELAAKDFAQACFGLCDRRPIWHGRTARWEPAVYLQMRGELVSRNNARINRAVPSSRAPLRLDVLHWLQRLDETVAGWAPGGTMYALRDLAGRRYAPADVETLKARTATLVELATAAATILGGALHVAIRVPCPACGARYAFVGAERTRVDALLATEASVTCRASGCHWPPERWSLLGAMLTST